MLVMSMTWNDFLEKVKEGKGQHTHMDVTLEERCKILNLARKAFEKTKKISDMEIGVRQTIAGVRNDYYHNYGCFGIMDRAYFYKNAINNNNPHLSNALDEIPLNGAVTQEHYNKYIAQFKKAFPNRKGDGRAGVSRLLALKRPDYFVCINEKNAVSLGRDIGIPPIVRKQYDRYWEEVIERIIDSVWWNEPRPEKGLASQIWDGRAAMLDVIFYNPK